MLDATALSKNKKIIRATTICGLLNNLYSNVCFISNLEVIRKQSTVIDKCLHSLELELAARTNVY